MNHQSFRYYYYVIKIQNHPNIVVFVNVCRHGDMLYLGFDAEIAEAASASTSMSTTGSLMEPRHVTSAGGAFTDNKASSSSMRTIVQEDAVDLYLDKQDGRIERDRDEHL